MPSATYRRAIPSSHSLQKRVQLRHTASLITLISHQPAPARIFNKAFTFYRRPQPLLLHQKHRSLPIKKPSDSTRPLRTMSSDEAYSSFLDQANQDTGASKASTQSKTTSTKAVDTDVPATLQNLEQYYTSEADEPFEPVSLKWSGRAMPSESMSESVPITTSE